MHGGARRAARADFTTMPTVRALLTPRLLLLAAVVVPQSTPTGGAIARFVPPVPTPASFIADPRDVIPAAAQKALDDRITAIQRAGLGDIAVAIIPSIGDYSASQVALEIYRTWRVGSVAEIGSTRRNVGVLILIVPKELSPNNRGECWINTGTGAEGFITDGAAAAICRDAIIPRLRERDHAGGVGAGISRLEALMRRDRGSGAAPPAGARGLPTTQPSPPAGSGGFFIGGGWLIGGGMALLIAAIIAFRRWRRHRPRKCANCGRMMERLSERDDNAKLTAGQVVEEQLDSVDYDVWSCRCGHALVIPYRRWFTKYKRCRDCGHLTATVRRRTIARATHSSTGLAEDRYSCKHCKAAWTESVVLPVLVDTSSDGSSGGGGGGGSSFGGSGSSSGGGGGSSY